MRFGLFRTNMHGLADPSALAQVVRHAEAAGLESLLCDEHMVFSRGAARPLQSATDPILDRCWS